LKNENISVSVACPGGMNTNFHVSLINRTGNFFSRIATLNPEDVAPIVIEKMIKGKEVIIPGRANRLSIVLNKLLPAIIKKMFTDKLMRDLKPIAGEPFSIQNELPTKAA
jgi:short-subunit dehydrogenase